MSVDKRTAVVIDDEKDLTAFLASILEEHGFAVRTANEAVTGEEMIREEPPDIVLIDLMMPGRVFSCSLGCAVMQPPGTSRW